MTKRKAIGKKVRFEVFKRDGFQCQYCGAVPPKVILHIDHIVPVAGGGDNSEENLITACDNCNLGKGARSLDAVPQSLKDKAEDAREREAQIKGYQEALMAARERVESECWQVAEIFMEEFGKDSIRKDWFASIKAFIQKIGVVPCLEAMDKATDYKASSENTCFRYFCGICWNIARESEQ